MLAFASGRNGTSRTPPEPSAARSRTAWIGHRGSGRRGTNGNSPSIAAHEPYERYRTRGLGRDTFEPGASWIDAYRTAAIRPDRAVADVPERQPASWLTQRRKCSCRYAVHRRCGATCEPVLVAAARLAPPFLEAASLADAFFEATFYGVCVPNCLGLRRAMTKQGRRVIVGGETSGPLARRVRALAFRRDPVPTREPDPDDARLD